MVSLYFLYLLFSLFALVLADSSSKSRALLKSRYSQAHSLGDSYTFDPRDGWQTINVTNLPYKYNSTQQKELRSRKKWKDIKHGGIAGHVTGVLKDIFRGLTAIGHATPVTITWYAGHDLENPSCWVENVWTPTDQSFICALTKDGWTDRPQCFNFLQLCSSVNKCIFVRVVDTCAGCAPGSHHVDLPRGPFEQLADLDKGLLTVNYRHATKPDSWYEELWGPKH